jgi:hypothetical protein
MTATAHKYQEDNLKLYGRVHQAKNDDLKYSTIIGAGRTICRNMKDNEEAKPTFSEVPSSYKATARHADAAGTTSGTKIEQTENTVYAFSYYQITEQYRNCNCILCSDLAAFKPKKTE